MKLENSVFSQRKIHVEMSRLQLFFSKNKYKVSNKINPTSVYLISLQRPEDAKHLQ